MSSDTENEAISILNNYRRRIISGNRSAIDSESNPKIVKVAGFVVLGDRNYWGTKLPMIIEAIINAVNAATGLTGLLIVQERPAYALHGPRAGSLPQAWAGLNLVRCLPYPAGSR